MSTTLTAIKENTATGNNLLTNIESNTLNLVGENKLMNDIEFSYVSAFGETKFAEYTPLSAWTFGYNINPDLIAQTVTNGGTVTQSGSFAQLSTSVANNGTARIETKKALRYQPGLGGLVRFTSVFSTGVASSYQLIGLGDSVDGLFFGFVNDTFGILQRNNSVDTFISQTSWNGTVFTGFDPTLLNVYQIQFQWLGGGELRFYIEDPTIGGFRVVHKIAIANTNVDVSLQNPTLPLSAEVKNTGNTTNIILKTPSATAGVEGKADNASLVTKAAIERELAYTASTEKLIVTLKNSTTYASKTNRLSINPILLSISAISASNKITTVKVYKNLSLTGPVYVDVNATRTPAQKDIASTAFSGGSFITGFVLGASGSVLQNIQNLNITLSPGETLSFTAKSTGNADVSVALTFNNEL